MVTTFIERHEVLDMISPQSASSAISGSWVSIAGFEEIAIIVQIGAIAASGVFNLDVNQATDSSGTGAKNVTDAAGNNVAITALADTDDDVFIGIALRPEYFDAEGGFEFVRVTATPSVAATLFSVVTLGARAHYKPAVVTGWEETIGV